MTFRVGGGAGVAIYEMPVEGSVPNHALLAFAAEAMLAAAGTVAGDVTVGDVRAEYHRPAASETLRAEAIVMRRTGEGVRVAADVLAGGHRVASFEADAARV